MNPNELAGRELFRFTGPPENWLTAIKYMTWGLEEKHIEFWKRIEPGDIFLMHSTSTNTIVKGAPSSVIGFGVVSPEFNKKNSPLWLQEIEQSENIWPLLVPFSEVYLFSKLRHYESLAAPTGKNNELIIQEAKELLSSASRLPEGFPKMGSFSRVRPEVVVKVFEQPGRFYLYRGAEKLSESYVKPTKLKKIDSPDDIIRRPVTLGNIDTIKKKTIKLGTATYAKDLQSLERAEEAHHNTLSRLLGMLREKGYETYSNRHVDLFAVRGNDSYLFEVKSFNKKNFRSQSRKGIVQLFEYEYFEIRQFIEDSHTKITPRKALIYSQSPTDGNYINFINNLKLSAAYFSEGKLTASGHASALANLSQ